MKKRILALLLAVVMCVALAACGGGDNNTANSNPPASQSGNDTPDTPSTPSEEPAFEGNRQIVVGVAADISTWDPWGTFNIARQNYAPLVYQALTADVPDLENNTMVHYNIMAESTEKLEGSTYQIKIRKGIVDSANNPFTADDAIFSFQTCIDAGRLAQVRAIEKMEKVDDLTFNMTLKAAQDTVGNFEDICAAINMVTQESYEASPDGMQSKPVGTGPMIMADYVPGDHVLFTKSENYWNEAANESKDPEDGYCSMWDMSNLDEILYRTITDESTMALELESGGIDIARALSDDDAADLRDNSDYAVFGAPEGDYGVAFNVSDGHPTANYNLRMAIALAIDSAGVLEYVADGDGVINKAWSYPTFVDYQAKWDSEPYFETDMNAAKEYLDKFTQETGIKASDLSLTLIYQNEAIATDTATAIQQYVGQLTGNPNTVTVNSYDRGAITQMKQDPTAYDMFIMNGQIISRMYSCYEWASLCNTTKQGWNIFHTDDAQLDELLLAAINVNTHNDETVSAFQQYLNDNCLIKVMFTCNEYGAAKSWVSGLDQAIGAKTMLNLGALTYDWNASGK